MFYCGDCGRENDWPTDFFVPQSRGKCECCNAHADCFDVPSRTLARLDEEKADPWAEIVPGETEAIESIKRAMEDS